MGPPSASAPYADGLAYSPATNRWRSLASMGSGRQDHVAVWTGRRMLVWGGQIPAGDRYAPAPGGLTYDPASDRWSALPAAPLEGRTGVIAAWTGTEMIIWGGYGVVDFAQMLTDGAAYRPAVT